MKTIHLLCFAPLLLASTGCHTFTNPARTKTISSSESQWLDFDASRRGGLLLATNSPFQVILEPAPDVAISSVAEFAAKASAQGKFDAEATAKITESLTSLGERTEAVMILRESLFRLNLLAANHAIDSNAVTNLFSQILAASQKIVEAEVKKQQAKIDQASADKSQSDASKSKSDADKAKADVAATAKRLQLEQTSIIKGLNVTDDKKLQMLQQIQQDK